MLTFLPYSLTSKIIVEKIKIHTWHWILLKKKTCSQPFFFFFLILVWYSICNSVIFYHFPPLFVFNVSSLLNLEVSLLDYEIIFKFKYSSNLLSHLNLFHSLPIYLYLYSYSYSYSYFYLFFFVFNTTDIISLGAPLSFFSTTPSGRISSRFSVDFDTIDFNIPGM